MKDAHFILVVYYFGTAELTGSRRWREMAQLLVTHGRVTVVCADGAGEDCEGIEVVQVPDRGNRCRAGVFAGRTRSGTLSTTVRRLVSSLFFWPDRQRGWSRRAVQRLGKLAGSGGPTFVITSGPIFSVHSEMCRWVGRNPGRVRWVMDFRDLWTNEIAPGLQRRTPAWLTAFERPLEQRCHVAADVVTTIGKGLARLLQQDFGSAPVVLYNGYAKMESPVPQRVGGPVSVRYLGTIIPGLRSPALLLQAAARLGIGADRLRFDFWCNDADRVRKEAEQAGAGQLLSCHPAVSQAEATGLAQEADANLVLNALVPEADQVVTGKVFELIAAQRPILAITGEDSELRKILESCAGQTCIWNLETACSALQSLLEGRLPIPADPTGTYSRQRAVDTLFDALRAP